MCVYLRKREREMVTSRGDEVSGEKNDLGSFLFIEKVYIKDLP